MGRPQKLEIGEIQRWLDLHTGWAREGDAIVKVFTFPDFAGAFAFATRVAMAAEKRDHHPDLEIGWGRARVRFSTHDAGGVTALDLEMAERVDSFA